MTAVTVGFAAAPATTGQVPDRISGGPELSLTLGELTGYARDLSRADGCTRPVRLAGRIDAIDLATGEVRPMYDTGDEPGGVMLKPW
jgi:hypothetical protein